jgi:putative protease
MPHPQEYGMLREYLQLVGQVKPDALIVADLGVLATVKELLPEMEVHISTQASIVSPATARAYAALGAKRLVLARELTLDEIRAIREGLDDGVELETFIHGSMCVSYSGRCLLSNFFTGRDGNRGACAQPCRWNFTITEEKRPAENLPVEQTPQGTFVLSSRDMCMIEHIPELMESGIDSFKIEGRMKSAYYTAVVTNAYRMAMDAYVADPAGYRFDPAWLRELESVSHRQYDTGFYFNSPLEDPKLCDEPGYLREKAYFASALEPSEGTVPAALAGRDGVGYFMQRNKVSVGDMAEVISPGRVGRAFRVEELYGEDGEPIESAPHPMMRFWTRAPFPIAPGDILRSGD